LLNDTNSQQIATGRGAVSVDSNDPASVSEVRVFDSRDETTKLVRVVIWF